MTDKNLITTTEAADILGVSLVRVWQMIVEGKFPDSYKFGNMWVLKRSSVEEFKRQKEEEQTK